MKIIAIYNIKGGVGKTAAAVNLSYLAATEGTKTLICDLDPQGSASYYFRVKPKIKSGLKPIMKGGKQIDRSIKGTDYYNLDLLPSDFSFRNLDLILDGVKRSRKRLRDSLYSLADQYDYIFLDCPPNITLVSENVFVAADHIIVPVIPTTLSVRTFEKLQKFFNKKKLNTKKILPFFSMVEKRKKMHNQIIDELSQSSAGFLKALIPYSSVIEKMGITQQPVTKTNPAAVAVQGYYLLWEEIKQMVRNK
jgi:cellulose biosynthesis protein BcsQ